MTRTFSIAVVQPTTMAAVRLAHAERALERAEEHEHMVERSIERHGGLGAVSVEQAARLWHAHEVVLRAEIDVARWAERIECGDVTDWAWC